MSNEFEHLKIYSTETRFISPTYAIDLLSDVGEKAQRRVFSEAFEYVENKEIAVYRVYLSPLMYEDMQMWAGTDFVEERKSDDPIQRHISVGRMWGADVHVASFLEYRQCYTSGSPGVRYEFKK